MHLFPDRMELVKHSGGCHCGAVRFEVLNSPDLLVFDCKYGWPYGIMLTKTHLNETTTFDYYSTKADIIQLL